MNNKNLIVQKYGGATLATPEKIKDAAQRICQLHKAGTQVVVVVSAMGQTTNDLIALANQVSKRPQLRELDMLLTVGERISMSLLSMALNDLGCSAISFTGSQAGILTDESHINAQIIDVKAFRVEEALKENKVVIMAGFQGVSPVTKEITTLGRGGSDTSAVAMAGYLKADRCEILKDVDSVYTADPRLIKNAKPIHQLNYSQLIEMTSWGAKVLHYRSVEMAQQKNVTLYVGPAKTSITDVGTIITNDFHFAKHQAVAVNSFNQVFKVQLNQPERNTMAVFNSLLQKNQIGQTQFLSTDEDSFYITAPSEILKTIEQFAPTQKEFTLLDKNISTVSLTYSDSATDQDLQSAEKMISKEKIEIIKSFQLMNSLHFFIKSEDKNKAIETLHNLI